MFWVKTKGKNVGIALRDLEIADGLLGVRC